MSKPVHVHKNDRRQCWELENQSESIEQNVDIGARMRFPGLEIRKVFQDHEVRSLGCDILKANPISETMKSGTRIAA